MRARTMLIQKHKEKLGALLVGGKGKSKAFTFPKGETSCCNAVTLSPSFSFLTWYDNNLKLLAKFAWPRKESASNLH